jgi:hypothetical protein
VAKTKKLPAKLAKYEVMGPIADALDAAVKKYLKTRKHPFHQAGWESPPPPSYLSQFPKSALVAKWYLIGAWTLAVEVYDGKIALDYSPNRENAATKRREFEILNADFDVHIADFLGKTCKCYFSPLWFRAAVDTD